MAFWYWRVRFRTGEPLAEAQRRWEDAVNDYERRRNEAGARVEETPALDDDTLVELLAGSLPVPEVVDALRAPGATRPARRTRECAPGSQDWGSPRTCRSAFWSCFLDLRRRPSERGGPSGCGPFSVASGGIVAGGLLGLQVLWAHVMLVFAPSHYLYHPGVTVLMAAVVTFAFYRAFVWDLRGAAAQRPGQTGAEYELPRSGPIGRMIDRGGAPTGCLLLIAIPLAAIVALMAFVILLCVTSIPSLLAMDAVGLIEFGPDRIHARRSAPLDIVAVETPGGGMEAVFNPLFNKKLYVVPHAILGALVGSFARRRWVIATSILIFLGLAAVANYADPTYLYAVFGEALPLAIR